MQVHLIKIMNNSKVNIILFAAGLGTRLRPATLENPKPVIPLFGIPMGYYALPYFESININKFIINTFHLPLKIRACYEKINKNFLFSDEKDFIKGSGGGLKQAQSLLDTTETQYPFISCNADEIFFTSETNFLNHALKQHLDTQSFATLIVTENSEVGHKFGGIWVDENSRVIGIGKDKPQNSVKGWHFTGLQILSPEVLKFIEQNKEQNIFYDVLNYLLNEKLVKIYPVKMDWYEVGNLADYEQAKKSISLKKDIDPIYIQHFSKLNQLPKSDIVDLS